MKIGYFVAFAIGGAVGFAAGGMFVKKHYEKICEEEIQSVKDAFRKASHNDISEEEKEETEKTLNEEYQRIAEEYKDEPAKAKHVSNVEVYTFQEYDELDAVVSPSDMQYGTLYSDGVFALDNDEVMSSAEIEETFGDKVQQIKDILLEERTCYVVTDTNTIELTYLDDPYDDGLRPQKVVILHDDEG